MMKSKDIIQLTHGTTYVQRVLCGIYSIVIGNADEVLKDPEQAFCSVRIYWKGSKVYTQLQTLLPASLAGSRVVQLLRLAESRK